MNKFLSLIVLILFVSCSNGTDVYDVETVGELPPNKIRRCFYESHTKINEVWHKHSGYHCHYWIKSKCTETHNGEQIPVPCWVEAGPNG